MVNRSSMLVVVCAAHLFVHDFLLFSSGPHLAKSRPCRRTSHSHWEARDAFGIVKIQEAMPGVRPAGRGDDDLRNMEDPMLIMAMQWLLLQNKRLMQVREETAKDPIMLQLHHYARISWPGNKNDVIPDLRSYWAFREELHTQDSFATHGFSLQLCTDNGPPFTSQQFQDFIVSGATTHGEVD
ncbi:uncharacterized protein LOC144152696 isoform X3 [Haemaphysalis longicornis]